MPQQDPYESSTQRPARPRLGLAATSTILGSASLLLVWVLGLGIILALAAIVFGIVGFRQSRGLALTGLVTGALSLLLGVAVLIIALVASGPATIT